MKIPQIFEEKKRQGKPSLSFEIFPPKKEAALKNIDLAQIMELVRQGAVGNLIEVDSSDGDIVRIYVE